MSSLLNFSPIFDPTNNAFLYLCQADDQTYWVRSANGVWAQFTDLVPTDLDSLNVDFQTYLQGNAPAAPADILPDDTGPTVTPPVKSTPQNMEPPVPTPPQNETPV